MTERPSEIERLVFSDGLLGASGEQRRSALRGAGTVPNEMRHFGRNPGISGSGDTWSYPASRGIFDGISQRCRVGLTTPSRGDNITW